MAAAVSASQTISSAPSSIEPFWKGRTPEIDNDISEALASIVHHTVDRWKLYNGDDRYSVGGVKEHELIRQMILKASPETKDFYVLDIGAGNYQWGRALAKYLNTKGLPPGVIVHIIGIRGETNSDPVDSELGQCRLHEFGAFPVERLSEEFKKRKLELINKVDLVVSRWCFRHLVDPVGTFAQAYDLLRPRTGRFLLDGFFFLYEGESMQQVSDLDTWNTRMAELCLETGSPFLMYPYSEGLSLNHFVVGKRDSLPCHLHKQYLKTVALDWKWKVGSERVTVFKQLEVSAVEFASSSYWGRYYGDKGMYEELKQNGVLNNPAAVWGPYQRKDADQTTLRLHRAIAAGDKEAIDRCLQEECDINESDETGSTPLHLAIRYKNYALFSQLLEKGALTNLFALGECTPLDLAIEHDLDGHFIRDLITAGADINARISRFNYTRLTPLNCAIQCKNIKAVELLLQAHAIVDYKEWQLLDRDSATFSSVQHLLPKRLSELEGFDTIIGRIQRGDCVILRYLDGEECLFRPLKFQMKGKEGGALIRVTVNPETRLLEVKNTQEIVDRSGCDWSRAWEADLARAPDLELRFGY